MKEESRVLVYSLGKYYCVFATYRRDFIEELLITRYPLLDLNRYLQKTLRTYNEVTYVIPCNDGKYAVTLLSRFRVIEGGDELLLKNKYCSLINMVLCMLDKRGLMNPVNIGLTIEISEKCL